MEREDSFLLMLQAAATIQHNISIILDAKALEAEKTRQWICNHLLAPRYSGHEDQLKNSIEIHGKIIEIIDGLAKLENSLARNLKIVLNKDDSSSGSSGFGGLSGFGSLLGQDGTS